ncbi:hypothetical protein BCR35DRAFT_132021 [Leucosporidium creatinivorum]|uniref:Uncharacterized protein n=1 Tax=Leucosporidium creatinivorum TaxID=106004 RepID=A0A1Y2G0D2_9BASI|nr:hypothetical protein BCR35DRAFT_132021 [Leucosporidium creatinivorum]
MPLKKLSLGYIYMASTYEDIKKLLTRARRSSSPDPPRSSRYISSTASVALPRSSFAPTILKPASLAPSSLSPSAPCISVSTRSSMKRNEEQGWAASSAMSKPCYAGLALHLAICSRFCAACCELDMATVRQPRRNLELGADFLLSFSPLLLLLRLAILHTQHCRDCCDLPLGARLQLL